MNLTRRELEVLILWSQGFSNHEIAKDFKVREDTVSKFSTRLKIKLNARTPMHAVSRAYELGILQIEKDEE
jgi:DNA-binding NarL/FixJ family response regulator